MGKTFPNGVPVPRLKRDWRGRRVRALRELRNGLGDVAAGTVLTVEENRGGLNLATDRCQCCGVRFTVMKVPESWVELLPEIDAGPGSREDS